MHAQDRDCVIKKDNVNILREAAVVWDLMQYTSDRRHLGLGELSCSALPAAKSFLLFPSGNHRQYQKTGFSVPEFR